MTTAPRDQAAPALDLIILAYLSDPKPPGPKELSEKVAAIALGPCSSGDARKQTDAAVARLEREGLVNQQNGKKRKLTEAGARVLREKLQSRETPRSTAIFTSYLPALAIGKVPGSPDAQRALADASSIVRALVRSQHPSLATGDLIADSDAIIRSKLGMTHATLTLDGIRAHVLLQEHGIQVQDLPDEARRITVGVVGPVPHSKTALLRGLAHAWAYTLAPRPSPRPRVDPPLPISSPDSLLAAVREALPRIGAEGRFGTEKVFVSAIWRRIARDGRVQELSLDGFKRWLIDANRKQNVDLARADLVTAMDPTLVKESEITDRGAIFHFVLDHQREERIHAR